MLKKDVILSFFSLNEVIWIHIIFFHLIIHFFFIYKN